MDVEAIKNEVLLYGFGFRFQQPPNVVSKILFTTGRATGSGHEGASGHIKVSDAFYALSVSSASPAGCLTPSAGQDSIYPAKQDSRSAYNSGCSDYNYRAQSSD
jgi:hypothetical protein